eukprot:440006_1
MSTTDNIPRHEDACDTTIIAFATLGIVQIAMAIIALWFVIGYLIRFRKDFIDQKIIIYSVILCLLLAFIQGSIRSFVLTNVFVAGVRNILEFRCSGLFWHQVYILQLNQLLMYIYLLSRIKSLQILQTASYYFLLILVTCSTLFTASILPWYNIPTIFTGDHNQPPYLMCINGTHNDSNIYEEYAIFLSIDAAVQCILLLVCLYQFYRLCTECGCWTCGANKFKYRIITLTIIVILFNLVEFIFFCITEGTFHAIRFIVYSIVIIVSFKICDKDETGQDLWCCWCCIDDNVYTKVPVIQEKYDHNDPIADNITQSKLQLSFQSKVYPDVINRDESIGLKC